MPLVILKSCTYQGKNAEPGDIIEPPESNHVRQTLLRQNVIAEMTYEDAAEIKRRAEKRAAKSRIRAALRDADVRRARSKAITERIASLEAEIGALFAQRAQLDEQVSQAMALATSPMLSEPDETTDPNVVTRERLQAEADAAEEVEEIELTEEIEDADGAAWTMQDAAESDANGDVKAGGDGHDQNVAMLRNGLISELASFSIKELREVARDKYGVTPGRKSKDEIITSVVDSMYPLD